MSFSEASKANEVGKRNPVDYRYDILSKEFIHRMAQVAAIGASKYGEYNFLKGFTPANGPINHIYHHLTSYCLEEPYDHIEVNGADDILNQLVAVAFNAMMEFMIIQNQRSSLNQEYKLENDPHQDNI